MDLQSLILLDFFVTILEIILDNNYLEVKKKKKTDSWVVFIEFRLK